MFSSLSLTLSTKSIADISLSLEQLFSPVVNSMITTPKLYISDRVEISPPIEIFWSHVPSGKRECQSNDKNHRTMQFDCIIIKEQKIMNAKRLLGLLFSHDIYCVYSGLFFSEES